MPENFLPYTVKTKPTWFDNWTSQPHLMCPQLTRALMPTIDSASFRWRAGEIMQAGESTYSVVPVLDLEGQYVRVEIPAYGIDWVGYFVNDRTARAAANDTPAIQGETPDYTAVGIEWFFSRMQIDSSVVHTEGRIGRAIGYNTGSGNGRSLSYANRGNKDTREYFNGPAFAEKPSTSELWNAYDILESLLQWHGPRNNAGNLGPFIIDVDPTIVDYLTWYTPTIQTEGRTLLEVLNQLIDRRRGLYWWLKYSDGAGTFKLTVTSGLVNSITLPGGAVIPQAEFQRNYDFDSDRSVAKCMIGQDGTQRYSRVKVRGARRRSVFTVSVADGTWEKSWTTDSEDSYRSAGEENTDAKKNDRYRSTRLFDRVYRMFRIPQDWDGMSGDGSGSGPQQYVCPEMPQDSTSITGGIPFSTHGIRLLRTTPLKAGFDYTDATDPTGELPAETESESLVPFALIEHGTKFVYLDRSAGHTDEDTEDEPALKTSYRLIPLASVPGMEINASRKLPHALAKNHFEPLEGPLPDPAPDPLPDGASEIPVEIDYEDIRLTVCAEWDSYCEGTYPDGAVTDNPVQELVLYIGERFRLDYLAQSTIFDIDEEGAVRKCTSGGPIQDDRTLCQDVANMAYEWYAIPRKTLSMSFHTLREPIDLGDMINQIGTTGEAYVQTINATVTQITLQPETGKSSMTAGFAELDFGGLV